MNDPSKNSSEDISQISQISLKKQQKRCAFCHRKLGMIEFNCPCSDHFLFCIHHRLPEMHNCTYDFIKEKNDYKKELLRKNPLIISPKISEI